jgi:hypothetical protein
MTSSPVAGPTPEPLTADPRYIDPAVLAKFDTLCSRMGFVADVVNAFTDPTLRERAFYELVGIINPSPDEPEPVDVIGVPQWGDAPASAVELGRLAGWIADKAPTAWRESVQPTEATADALIRFLDQGAAAWTQVLLVKHALMTAGGFTTEQVDGDLPALIREMAADKPVSPEVEQLALYLHAARPDEPVVDVARQLMESLAVDQGLRREPDRVDDRAGERTPQPDGITAAIPAYKDRTGTS